MSNRRKLRPSLCRAVGRDGHLLVRQAVYKDPGAYAPPGRPTNLTPKPRERRFRPGGPVKPVATLARLSHYARQRNGLMTPAQRKRTVKKLRRSQARERTRT